jgi:ATP-dependent DNA ligase
MPKEKVVSEVHLQNEAFGHSKRYHSQIIDRSDEYLIINEWGKIGGSQQRQEKGPFETLEEAHKKYDSLVAAKMASGYSVISQSGTAVKSADPTHGQDLETLVPMGAVEDEDVEQKLGDPNYLGEPKFDGSHYLLKFLGKAGLRLHSRKLSVKDNRPVDKTLNVPHIMEEVRTKLLGTQEKEFALDGEILCQEEGSNLVTSVMGSKPEKAKLLQEQNGYVRFMVFDLPWFEGHPMFDVPFHERRAVLEAWFKDNGPFRYLFLTPQVMKNKKAFRDKVWAEGKEGIMLKRLDGLYEPGNKPKDNWIKIKAKKTDEFVVMDFIPGEGKYDGLIGAIVFGQYDPKGQLVKVSQASGMTDEERKKISKNPRGHVGRVVEIEFQERTKDGSLRHPRFLRWREDKNAKECVLK